MDLSKVNTRYLRQEDLLPDSMRGIGINIIGVGAVGSFTALALAKMGFSNIKVFDHDKVEEHNISNQFYKLADIGKLKVEALAGMIKEFEDINIQTVPEKYTGDPRKSLLPGIVISAVDSIAARQEIYKHIKNKPQLSMYIDLRMSLEFGEIHVMNPNEPKDFEYYESTIKDPKDVIHDRCTAKAVMHNVLSLASFAGSIVTRFVRKENVMIKKHIALDLINLSVIVIEK